MIDVYIQLQVVQEDEKLPVAMPSNKERTLIGRRKVAGIDG